MPTKINFGRNCLAKLTGLMQANQIKNILIFTGDNSAKVSGALEEVKDRLSGFNLLTFKGVKSNPTIESLKSGIRICKKEPVGLIVSIGGGSVIDYGKAVSVLSKAKGNFRNFFYKGYKLKRSKIKFVAVPTTFGSSSEITPYAVMTDKERAIKITLADDSMYPDWAFIDPKFTLTMPKSLVATSCADLLSHAMEAYWSINATELTDNFAISAIELFLRYYQKTHQKTRDLKIRKKLSLASLYAGLAFSNTKTTACHSISYPMTTIFNIPHGIACILTLAEMLKFNSNTIKGKILRLGEIMGCKDVQEVKEKIESTVSNLGIKKCLRDYGLTKSDLRIISNKGFTPEKMINNPRKVTKRDLKKILESIY